jgi:hypothetical protein
MKYIDYFFFKYYCIIMKTGDKNSPQIITFIGIATMLCFNILSVYLLIGVKIEKNEVLGIMFLLISAMYFLFIFKQRYLKIYNRFVEKDPYPVLGNLIVESYMIISFIILIISAWVARG